MLNQINHLIDHLGLDSFFREFSVFLQQNTSTNSILLLNYQIDAAPIIVHDEMAESDRKALQEKYFDGIYLLSPFYNLWLSSPQSHKLVKLQDICPEGFFSSVYYEKYYGMSKLTDEYAYIIPFKHKSAILVSIGRTEGNGQFADKDFEFMNTIKESVFSLITKHLSLINLCAQHSHMFNFESALRDFTQNLLTSREIEVVRLMLKGHSSKSCAKELNISPATERVHRRHIYEKFSISSQAGLFSKFFDSLVK